MKNNVSGDVFDFRLCALKNKIDLLTGQTHIRAFQAVQQSQEFAKYAILRNQCAKLNS